MTLIYEGLPASGVVGALFGGVICASAILQKNLVSKVTKPFVPRKS
jgi:hypothetical protein